MSVERGSASKPSLDRVLREEADFANRDYGPHADHLEINPNMFRRYHSPTELWDWRQRSVLLLGDIAGKDLLDLGCGMGEESIDFSKLGARVTAVDISEVGIASLQVSGGRERSRDAGRREQFVRVLCVLCLATFAGASCAGEGGVPSSMPSSAHKPVVCERRDSEERWRETAPMALFGAGLSYVGFRLRKRKA